nr:MAG TPA: hypothetical protein [Caudoviricetes sp.]
MTNDNENHSQNGSAQLTEQMFCVNCTLDFLEKL